jgi:hypothetical protein
LRKITILLFSFIRTDLKVLQLLNAMRSSKRLFFVGYTSPQAIFSLSHVQNVLGDEGDYRPLQTPQTEGGTFPFWQPLMYHFDGGPRRKSGHFFNNISQTKSSVCEGMYALFEASKKGGEKRPSKHVYMREKVNIVRKVSVIFVCGAIFFISNIDFMFYPKHFSLYIYI